MRCCAAEPEEDDAALTSLSTIFNKHNASRALQDDLFGHLNKYHHFDWTQYRARKRLRTLAQPCVRKYVLCTVCTSWPPD